MTDITKERIARHWQAGDAGCGQLIVGLSRELGQIEADELLQVVALDAGARIDLPAWCRMAGHTLVAASPPVYLLRNGGSRFNTQSKR